MKEINDAIPYKQILDETNQLIQVSRRSDFTMLYANMAARKFAVLASEEHYGMKCYKYMMGAEEQCPFCPMRQMEDKISMMTEIDNGNQVFSVKTKKIMWEGEEAFVEYAVDITAIRRAEKVFESQMQLLLQSIPEAQGIFHLNLTQDKWLSSNGVSANIQFLQDIPTVDMLIRQVSEYIPDEVMQKKFIKNFSRESLINSYESGKTEIVEELLSYYEDESVRWTKMTARLIMNPHTGDLECILYGMDINEEKFYKDRIKVVEKEKELLMETARRDVLTGVYSKKAFEQLSEDYIKHGDSESFTIIFLDIDHFKKINDTLGHLMGDEVIIDYANKLQTIFANKDIISRFGGDEFCLLIKEIPLYKLKDKLEFTLERLKNTYTDGENSVSVTVSIGAAFCECASDIYQALNLADKALYEAKEKGRDRYCIKEWDGGIIHG